MALVYQAYQPALRRYVALKVLPPQYTSDRQFVERFQREGRAAAGLRHPDIVVVHDAWQDDGLYYIVMELLEGRALKELVEGEGALAKEPGERYESAGAFAGALLEAAAQVERDWLDGQVAEKEAWLAAGQCEQAIQRLEALAAAYPQSEAVAGKLAQSREGARLAGLCAGMQQLWAQARAQAEEIQAADPHYPDPDGPLRQLL